MFKNLNKYILISDKENVYKKGWLVEKLALQRALVFNTIEDQFQNLNQILVKFAQIHWKTYTNLFQILTLARKKGGGEAKKVGVTAGAGHKCI